MLILSIWKLKSYFRQTNPYNAGLDNTLTVFRLNERQLAFDTRLDVRSWQLITHYPMGPIAGGDQLCDGFA